MGERANLLTVGISTVQMGRHQDGRLSTALLRKEVGRSLTSVERLKEDWKVSRVFSRLLVVDSCAFETMPIFDHQPSALAR